MASNKRKRPYWGVAAMGLLVCVLLSGIRIESDRTISSNPYYSKINVHVGTPTRTLLDVSIFTGELSGSGTSIRWFVRQTGSLLTQRQLSLVYRDGKWEISRETPQFFIDTFPGLPQ